MRNSSMEILRENGAQGQMETPFALTESHGWCPSRQRSRAFVDHERRILVEHVPLFIEQKERPGSELNADFYLATIADVSLSQRSQEVPLVFSALQQRGNVQISERKNANPTFFLLQFDSKFLRGAFQFVQTFLIDRKCGEKNLFVVVFVLLCVRLASQLRER